MTIVDYSTILQKAIECFCRGEYIEGELAQKCPHHAEKLNLRLKELERLQAETQLLLKAIPPPDAIDVKRAREDAIDGRGTTIDEILADLEIPTKRDKPMSTDPNAPKDTPGPDCPIQTKPTRIALEHLTNALEHLATQTQTLNDQLQDLLRPQDPPSPLSCENTEEPTSSITNTIHHLTTNTSNITAQIEDILARLEI